MIKPDMLCMIVSKYTNHLNGMTCRTVSKRISPIGYGGEDGWVIDLENGQSPLYAYDNAGRCQKTSDASKRGIVRESSLVPIDGYEGDDRDESYEFTPEDLVEV